MGKNKEPDKKDLRPSTTRKGTNLPTRSYFSANVATTPAIKNKVIVQTSSQLSII
jgi:hypothetical protein